MKVFKPRNKALAKELRRVRRKCRLIEAKRLRTSAIVNGVYRA